MAVNVNQLQGSAQATTYAAISEPSKTVYIPRVVRNATWNDGFVIRNTAASSSANVVVTFYNTNGAQNGNALSYSISSNGYRVIVGQGQVPNNFSGSVVITSNRNIAVSVNNLHSSGNGDIISSYPADHD